MRVRSFPLSRHTGGGVRSSPFNNGLRPREELDHDVSYLLEVENVYLSADGSFNAEKFTRTFTLNESAQIFPTYIGIFVLTSTVLYSWNGSALSSLLSGLTPGGLWSVADFGSYILFTNGSVNLVRNPTTGVFATDSGTLFPLATSICAHRGRLILGGITDYPESGSYPNWVAWSDINNLAFVNRPLLSTTIATLASQVSFTLTAGSAVDDTYNDAIIVITDAGDATVKAFGLVSDYTGGTKTVALDKDPAIFTMAATDIIDIYAAEENDQTRRNLSGYMPMPWEGSIQKIAPLEDKVIVYGDNGVTAMVLASAVGTASTYGQKPVSESGIKEQGAMAMNGKNEQATTHYFVDKTGWLNMIDVGLVVNRLGYKEFLS